MKLTWTIATLVFIVLAACTSGGTKHHNRGVELAEQGRWEEAIVEFDMAIELDGDPLSYMARAITYGALDDFDRALADLDKAIDLDSGWGEAYRERGAAYALTGDTEQALADLQMALSLVNDDQARAEIRDQSLSSQKARAMLGWKHGYSLESGLCETIAWYQSFLGERS